MSLSGVIAKFQTGVYSGSRPGTPTFVDGIKTPGAPSPLSVPGSLQPITGLTLQALPEGLHGANTRVLYTTTEMLRDDELTVDGETWRVFRVEDWELPTVSGPPSDKHFEVYLARQDTP